MVRKYIVVIFLILIMLFACGYAEDDAVLELDKGVYEGLSDRMKITLTAPALNKDIRMSEVVFAKVNTTDNSSGINIFLVETGKDTGVFKSDIRFSFGVSNAAERTIKVRNGIKLYVQCEGLKSEAVWVPYDAALELDSDIFTGLGDSPEITLTDYDLNALHNAVEEVKVLVKSTSDSEGISFTLKESAADSGVFKGSVKLTTSSSDSKDGRLHVEYKDEITIIYKDTTVSGGPDKLCTDTAVWTPQTASVKLSSESFVGLNSKCGVTITDNDMNISKDIKDTVNIEVISDTDPKGINLKLYETETDSGIFNGDIFFSNYSSSSDWNTLKVASKSDFKVIYWDDRNEMNEKYVPVDAGAKFQFAEGVLSISGGAQSGKNDSITITVKDSDADTNDQRNTLPVNITSHSTGEAITLWLEETGKSSGSFKRALYFSTKKVTDKAKKDVTLLVSQGDAIEITYKDTTVPDGQPLTIRELYTWSYREAVVVLDESSYTGYNSSTTVSVNDSEANCNPKSIDKVKIRVSSTSMPEFTMLISETKADSGIFKGTIHFGRQGNRSEGILKVSAGDKINVSYEDQGEYSYGTVEATAVWNPHDAELKLDSDIYYGNNAEVDITVKDWDMAENSDEKDSIAVSVGIAGKSTVLKLPLKETGKDTGVFTGTFAINSSNSKYMKLRLLDGEELEVIYVDQDNSEGRTVERRASAVWKLTK